MELQAFVDWFQFTIKGQLLDTVFKKILCIPQENFVNLKRGMQGYQTSYSYNKIIVLADGNADMGVHVIMSSGAIGLYASERSFFRLISRVLGFDGNITRIDIAVDDYLGKIIRLDKIKEDIANGLVLSKWRNYTHIKKAELGDNILRGETLYFGSRTSDIFMRIYRKDLEQGDNRPERKGWTRLELEFKKEKAKRVASKVHLSKNINKEEYFTGVIHAILNNYIRFLRPGKGLNKSRWQTAQHWEKFITTAEKMVLSTKKENRTLDDVKGWIHDQVATSIAMLIDSAHGDVGELVAYALEGKKRYKDKHLKMLQEYSCRDDKEE